jgi:hypothetical protein
MDKFTIEVRKSTFPIFEKVRVKIGDSFFYLSSGEIKRIDIPNEGEYVVEVSHNWVICKKSILLNRERNIILIDFALPNWYYFMGAFILIPLSILALLSIIKPVYQSVPLVIFLAPIFYYAIFNTRRYFKIKSTNQQSL